MTDRRRPRVLFAEILGGFEVRITFSDGVVRTVDLFQYLRGPVFRELHDPQRFNELEVDAHLGTIVWPNGADIDPDVLYGDNSPAWQDAPRAHDG